MKSIRWNIKAKAFVKELDTSTKREIGSLLMMLQMGLKLKEPQSKPMKVIHPRAHELRVKDRKGIYRLIYVLTVGDEILVPHAFTKKTQQTTQNEIETAIKRLKELIYEKKD